jgi:hypothetical protein
MPEELNNMSKEKLLESYGDVCKQLEENKRILEPYFGKPVEVDSSIARIYELTQLLFTARYDIKKTLMTKYGLFIMDDDNF